MLRRFFCLLFLLIIVFSVSNNTLAIEEEQPIFGFGLSDTWGLLNVYIGDQTYQEPHDFVIEISSRRYAIQTTSYYNKSSIEVCDIFVYEDQFKFLWKLVDGAHEEFVSATVCNKENDEATTFNIENSGIVFIPYYDGLNDYDLYCYTGKRVGIIEFDLFDVLILYVEEL
jgi:hypothetical protein